MNIISVQLIQSSDLFNKICEHFNHDWNDNFAGEFSEACDVSYGDASHTLINAQSFGEILLGMEHRLLLDEIKEVLSWIPEGVMIDLES